jgi:hypothetical protein
MVIAACLVFGFASEARADNDDGDRVAEKDPDARTPYALSFNPGAIVIGHYGGQFEYSLMPHHAIIASAAYVSATTSDSDHSTRSNIKGLALELGWRFYTGSSGPVGGFFGPSLLAGAYVDPNHDRDGGFTVLGGAVDIGFQTKLGSWALVGAGVGVQTTQVSERYADSGNGKSIFTTHAGLLPRLLVSLGGTFDVK